MSDPDSSPAEQHHDPRTVTGRRIAVASFCLLALVAGLAFLGVIQSGGAQSSADQAKTAADNVAKGNELQACRSVARGPVDDAIQNEDQVTKQTNDLVLDVIGTGGDRAAYLALAQQVPAIRAAADKAFAARTAALDEYQVEVRLSVSDPAAFLARCRAKPH